MQKAILIELIKRIGYTFCLCKKTEFKGVIQRKKLQYKKNTITPLQKNSFKIK
jgi:hypothetical protein